MDGEGLFFRRGDVKGAMLFKTPARGGTETLVHQTVGQNGWHWGERRVLRGRHSSPAGLVLIPLRAASRNEQPVCRAEFKR